MAHAEAVDEGRGAGESEQTECAGNTARRALQECEHFSRTAPAGAHELASSLAGAEPQNQQQGPLLPISCFLRSPAFILSTTCHSSL